MAPYPPAFLPSTALPTPPPSRQTATTPRRRPRLAVATPPPPLYPPNTPSLPPPSQSDPLSAFAPKLTGLHALETALRTTPSPTPDTLIVVMFHARWCRVCKTLSSKLPRVAKGFPHVVWYRVDFAEIDNRPLCAQLNVKLLPTFRFYRPGMEPGDTALEDFTAGPFGTKRLQERLDKYPTGWSN